MRSRIFRYSFVLIISLTVFIAYCLTCNAETVGFVAELSPDLELKNWVIYKRCIFYGHKMKNGNFLVSTPEYFLEIEPMPSSRIVNAYIAENPVSAQEFSDGTLLLIDGRKAARYTKSGKTMYKYNKKDQYANYGLILPDDSVMLSFHDGFVLKSLDNELLSEYDKTTNHLSDTFEGKVLAATFSPHAFFEFDYNGKFLKNNYVSQDEIGSITRLKKGFYVLVSKDFKKMYLLDQTFKTINELTAHGTIRGADVLRNGNFLIYGECEFNGKELNIFADKPYILDEKVDLKFLYE